MANELLVSFNSMFGELTTIDTGDKILFKANDVLKSLGYSEGSWRTILSRKCRGVTKCNVPHPQNNDKTIEINFITEGDIYRLVGESKLPSAEKFEKWVFDDVLPQIRQTGGYIPIAEEDNDEAIMAKALMIAQKTLLKKDEIIAQQKQQLLEYEPKVSYYDLILSSKDTVTITQIAKDYGLTAQELNDLLHSFGIQYKQSGTWLLYADYAKYGYTKSDTFAITHKDGSQGSRLNTKWTQKGRLFIYDTLKKNDILPIIEK